MKIRSLLLAASAVAMSATAANAISITTPSGNGANILAAELDLASAPVGGLYGLTVAASAGVNFPTNTPITVDITLPAGRVFSTSTVTPTITAGTNSGSVTGGGTAGSSTIQFTINNSDNQTALVIANMPVDATASVAMGDELSVSVMANGAAFDGGTDTDDTVFVASEAALSGITVVADTTASTITQTATGAFNTLSEAVVGTVAVDAIATPNADNVGPAGADAPYVSLLNAMGTAVAQVEFAAANIASTVTTVEFPAGVAGLDGATLGAVNGVASGNNFSFNTTGSGLLATPTAVSLDDEAAAMGSDIIAQTPDVTSVAATLTGTGITFTSPSVLTDSASALETLVRAGNTGGQYDWVGETGTLSVFRAVGLPVSAAQTYTVSFANSITGQNGTFAGSGTTNAAGELVLVSGNAFGTSNTGYGRADVTFQFDGAATPDVDRQLFRSGVVSAFGNDDGTGADD